MRNMLPSFLACSLFLSYGTGSLLAQTDSKEQTAPIGTPAPSKKSERKGSVFTAPKFTPFTGKITKAKVRLRLQPGYDGTVLREMQPEEYVVVLDENDDFYGIQPPADFRGYVFRSYILDNVVEADRVNIRLRPDKEATIIGQLKAGDQVETAISPENNKWYEVKLPSKTRFYIAKEYVSKMGDAGLKDRLDKKREAAINLLATTNAMSLAELQKPFDQASITGIKANYQHLINDYSEFPDLVAKAKDSLNTVQDNYNARKLQFLEEQSRLSAAAAEANKKLNAELQAHKNKINHLESKIEQERQQAAAQAIVDPSQRGGKPTQLPVNMSIWIPAEERLFNAWSQQAGGQTPQQFYEQQKEQGINMRGIVDVYNRSVKNKPGDYMLLNPASKLPVAFLYSTQVNLQDYVGHEVTLRLAPRDNYNFAFPAYFVLTIE